MLLAIALTTVVLSGLVAVCCAALVEIFRQLGELREVLNLGERAIPLNIKPGEIGATEIGLPDTVASQPEAIVVFLSPKCATCFAIAEAFRGGAPETVWFVVSGETAARSPVATYLRACEGRLLLDRDETIARASGLDVTPAVLTIRWGEIVRAQAVSSPRQVMNLVPTVAPAGVPRRNAPPDAVGGERPTFPKTTPLRSEA